MIGTQFEMETGVKILHVPYKGSAPLTTDLLGGQVDMSFDTITPVLPFIKEGKLKALAYGSTQRSTQFPQVPTLAEAGWGNTNLVAWFGMAVKAGTTRATVDRLGEEVVKAIQSPDVSKRFIDQGLEISAIGPAQFAPFIDQEIARWGKVIRDAGIKLE